MSSRQNFHLTFRPDLQGLRAIAVLIVIFEHSKLGFFSGGFVGVDIFFVLSGYLISGLLLKELNQNNRISFLAFYARRLKRLLPALLVMLVATFLLALWLLSGFEAFKQLASMPYSAFWVSNLYFAFSEHDYFDELSNRDLFLHTWSLGVEEQFYLIWPLVLTGIFWLVQTKKNKHSVLTGKLALWGIFLISFLFSVKYSYSEQMIAFYMMPTRIWQFSMGAMLQLYFKNELGHDRQKVDVKTSFSKYWASILSWLGIGLIMTSAVVLNNDDIYPGFFALIPSIGAALVIWSGNFLQQQNQYNFLAQPIMVWIGDRSYSWYLWHWPFLILGFSLGYEGQSLAIFGLILSSLLIAMVSYKFVELPFWKGSLNTIPNKQIFLYSAFLMLLPLLLYSKPGLIKDESQYASQTTGNQWRSDIPQIYQMPCDSWYANSQVQPCIFQEDKFDKTVVLLGDSIGAQWFSMVPTIFSSPAWRTIVLTKSSCPMVDEEFFYDRIGKIYQVCSDWRNSVLDEIDKIKPDLIIAGSASTYNFKADQWVEGSKRIIARLSNSSEAVLIIPGTPSLGFDGPGCVARHSDQDGIAGFNQCVAKNRLELVQEVTGYLTQAIAQFDNVYLLDLNDLVCPGGNCYAVQNQKQVVFRDQQHLTDSFVRQQVPEIYVRINRILTSFQPG